jgi:serine/threonine protein kinase
MGNTTKVISQYCEKLFGPKRSDEEKETNYNDLRENLNLPSDFDNDYLKRRTFTESLHVNKLKNSSSSNKSLGFLQQKISIYDFRIIKTLGKGSFGKVLLVSSIHSKKYYAMKVLKKDFLKKQNQVAHTKTEREILEKITHPFVVKLHYAFQSSDKLYLVCDYMPGGEIFYHLRKEGCFSEERTRFYVCEMVLALEHLHRSGVIYRDLKPENILLDKEGHIKLTDFGLSKILKSINIPPSCTSPSGRAYTICGTPEYLAPEILVGKGYNRTVDWWSLGAVMYEMLVGHSPFKDNKYKLDLSTYLKPIQPHRNISPVTFNFIKLLLQPDPGQRLGASDKDADDIKNHDYFKDVNWTLFLERKVRPKFRPYLKHEEDLSNFDKLFTDEDPNSFYKDKFNLFPSANKEKESFFYENFSYIPEEH